jgi:LCP family protein required for cell wall assembly
VALRRSVLRAFSGRYLIALGVATAVMTGGVVTVNYVISDKLAGVKRVQVKEAPPPPQGANYLLLGSDTRAFVKNNQQAQAFGNAAQDPNVNSDTMMVVHVEPNAKRTLIVSFPRDLWVNIPGRGMAKINAAYGIGPNKTIETLKADFGIDINHFISVDFQSFQDVVNAIGQVPVYFPYPARDRESGLFIYPGCVRLNGAEALAYARSRTLEFYSQISHQWQLADPTADIGRIARQQQFIRELAGIAVQRSLQDPITGNDIVNKVLHYLVFDQNLSKSDVLSLIDVFRTVNPNDQSHLEFQTMPWKTGPNQNGAQVLYVQEPDNQGLLARLRDFSGKNSSAPAAAVTPRSVTVQVVDSTGTVGLAQATLNDLVRRAGFAGGSTGQVSGALSQTEVHYKPGAIAQGELLLQYLPPSTPLVADPSIKGAGVELVLGRGFSSIVIPSGGGSTSAGPVAPTPQAAGPSSSYSAGDTYANGNGGVDPARFGIPAPKGSCR